MATTEEIQKLAALSRIKIDDSELEKFTSEFDAILDYVGQLEKLDIPLDPGGEKPLLRNVMRTEGEAIAAHAYTEKIAEQFPAGEGDALVVKQIITHE